MRPRVTRDLATFAVVLATGVVGVSAPPDATVNEPLAGRQVFPSSNWWNQDVSQTPVDPASRAFIDFVSGRTPTNPTAVRRLHPDFGPPPYGIPYVVVPGLADDFEVVELGWGRGSAPRGPWMLRVGP